MSEKLKLFIRDSAITILTLTVFFFISLIIHTAFNSPSLIPPLFVLAVFLISLFTNGYKCGNNAVLISVLAALYGRAKALPYVSTSSEFCYAKPTFSSKGKAFLFQITFSLPHLYHPFGRILMDFKERNDFFEFF